MSKPASAPTIEMNRSMRAYLFFYWCEEPNFFLFVVFLGDYIRGKPTMDVLHQGDDAENDTRSQKDQPLGIDIGSKPFGNQAAHHASSESACAYLTEGSGGSAFFSFFEDVTCQ